MKKLIAGNWKMNGTVHSAVALARDIETALESQKNLHDRCDFVVCPPFVHLLAVKDTLKTIALGAQDCAAKDSGAYTGDIAAPMLNDLGAQYVILGHSERRQYHQETDAQIASKAAAAHNAGLITIICVGETEQERIEGKQNTVVQNQLAGCLPEGAHANNTVIAYEPVWAIGTGKTATVADIAAMHGFIRGEVCKSLADGANIRILYGGSVKPANAAEIFAVPDVNGALIGGASLKAEDYLGIAAAG